MGRLTDTIVQKNIEKTVLTFQRCGRAYQRGILNDARFFQEMELALDRGFRDLLRSGGIVMRIDETNYLAFSRAYQFYLESGSVDKPDRIPWLFDENGEFGEANAYDRKQVFTLMRAFGLSPEYFEPVPAAIPGYRIHGIHQYRSSGVYGIDFPCVDDGGLIGDPSPVGKTFRLRNDQGLEARLTIKEDRRYRDRTGMDFDEVVIQSKNGVAVRLAEFLAEGTIEGYTAAERYGNPEILIRLRNGGTEVYWLAYWRDADDERAFSDFPLWQARFRWNDEKRRRQIRLLTPLFDRFKSDSPG